MEKMNAVIYARYSSDKQTEQSIEGQIRDCMAYAERLGLKITEEYIDRAISGTSDKRPEFQRMIADSAKKKFNFVLVYKFDRFSRNMYDSAIYERKLEINGVRLISVTEQLGEGNESIIVKALLRAMAEVYSKQLGQNVQRGMRESALKANSTGGAIPPGYRIENKKLVIDEKTAPFVRYIFEAYSQGKPKTVIIKALAEKGYKKANGKPVTIQNVTYILGNKKYTGVFTYNDIEVEGGCPSLIDKELFEICKERTIREKKNLGHRIDEDVEYLLFGKLFCGHCGKPMHGDCGTSQNGTRYHYYACSTRKGRSKTGGTCNKKRERKAYIEHYLVQQTLEYVLNPKRIDYIAGRMVEEYNKEFSQDKIDECNKRLEIIEHETNMAVEALIRTTNEVAVDKINEKLGLLDIQRADAQDELAELQIVRKAELNKEETMEWLKSFCKGRADDEAFQRRIINTFINSVYLYDDKIVIYYNVKTGGQVSYSEMLEQTSKLADNFDCSCTSHNGEPKNRDVHSYTSVFSLFNNWNQP